MPDIAKCNFSNCPKSKECWRFVAPDSQYQNYAEFKNICKELNNFEHFWKIQ